MPLMSGLLVVVVVVVSVVGQKQYLVWQPAETKDSDVYSLLEVRERLARVLCTPFNLNLWTVACRGK